MDRLILQDDTADELTDCCSREEHLAVGATTIQCRFDFLRIEALGHSGNGLVRRQYAFSAGDQCLRSLCKLINVI